MQEHTRHSEIEDGDTMKAIAVEESYQMDVFSLTPKLLNDQNP